jgi:hypothetical protein
MKTKMSAVCLIAMLSLSACNSNANSKSEVNSDSVRLSGNERCFDLEKTMSEFGALPATQPVLTQVTNIYVVSGPADPAFEESAIRSL